MRSRRLLLMPPLTKVTDLAELKDHSAQLAASQEDEVGLQAWLYDVQGDDAPIKVSDVDITDLSDQQILWIDLDLRAAGEVRSLLKDLGIADRIGDIVGTIQRPEFISHENFVQLNVLAVRDDWPDSSFVSVYCLVGKNWIATLHQGELDLVEKFNRPLSGDTALGALDSASFLGLVLEWHLSGYLKVIERVQGAIDEVDELLLKPRADEPGLLERLFQLRRRITKLRRALSPHRDVFGPLSNPHSALIASLMETADFSRLSKRLENALQEVTTAREMVAVSFDIYMTQVSQNTNDIMKRLTLVSVLLLPAVLLAGIMGMNFKVGLFDVPFMFWVTIATMGILAIATLVFARRRKWF